MVLDLVCRKCGEPFSYEWGVNGRKRERCDACDLAARRDYRRQTRRRRVELCRLQEGEETAAVLGFAGVTKCGREEVAKAFGVTASRVAQIERLALARIRARPDLRACYAAWLADGAPIPSPGPKWGELGPNAVAGWLVRWIQAFLRWRRVAELLAEAPETQAEAEEMRREIAPFERVVAKAAADLSHEIRDQKGR